MTLNECEKYHETLWQKIIEKIEEIANGTKRYLYGMYDIKEECIKEMLEEDENIPLPNCNCFLCEYYDDCIECPLGGTERACLVYHKFCRQMGDGEFREAIETAKQIRDVFNN